MKLRGGEGLPFADLTHFQVLKPTEMFFDTLAIVQDQRPSLEDV